jgi:hypothetical protein
MDTVGLEARIDECSINTGVDVATLALDGFRTLSLTNIS